ncbi:hypothetical protein LTR36_000679 [Oleoguttula mirabilis]|uniref:Putative transcription factor kapC n=1 Tax=Oleoguttula mirabilis TaxID=1507867 RepID=A0AAV9JQ37_9PEZI|nr:hypothetical protein LTR36_000679 [Oleoguttula mirabilis]
MQHAPAQNLEMMFSHQDLREQLLAAGTNQSPYPPPPTAGAQGPEHPYQASDSASPHDHLDPNVAQQQQAPYAQMSGGDSAGDDGLSPSGSKGKRELSTSKRAAQNRAAQRAFRQRKEGYIKKLEEQVKDFQNMEQNYRSLQNENYQLREYILNLQSRLLETQSDIPPAPSHVNLNSSSAPPAASSSGAPGPANTADQNLRRDMVQHAHPPEQRPHEHDAISQLQAAAAQADAVQPLHQSPYGLGGGADPYPNKRQRLDEEGAPGGDVRAGQ